MIRYIIVIALLIPAFLSGQGSLQIGDWQAHLPYQGVRQVTQSAEKVYYATDESIMIIDKSDDSIDFLTKVDGLSDTGVQDLLYDEINDQLIIAYTSSVIDVVQGSEIYRITDIRDKSSIQGDKQIYDLYNQAGQFLYLATGFGLVQLDLVSLEFGFTLDISTKVLAVDGYDDRLIIGLDGGSSYVLDLESTNAPGFFDEWTEQSVPLDTLSVDYQTADVYMSETGTYIATKAAVYVAANDSQDYEALYTNGYEETELIFINPTPEGWMLGIYSERSRSKIVFFDEVNNQIDLLEDCTKRLLDAELDDSGRIYLTDHWKRIRYKESINGACSEFINFGPYDASTTGLAVSNGVVYGAPGGISENFFDRFEGGGFYILEEGTWTNINKSSSEYLADREIIHIHKVAASPAGDKVYFASFWAGVLEYDVETGEMHVWDESNSSLQPQIGDGKIRISGLAVDKDNNLWVSNYSTPRPISVLKDGQWQSYPLLNATTDKVEDLIIDDNNFVWVTLFGPSGGIVILDPETGEQRLLNQNGSAIESNFVNSVAVDQNGAVWVGTGVGAVVFECGSSALDAEVCPGNRPVVRVDGIDAYLLESEEVLCIAVDGANRKWFGTRNGIFVQSPSGRIQVAQYDIDNSPLFDNTIRSMAYNPADGVMYIATNKGIQSIRTETTSATNRHTVNVYAFPNPVRPEYEGPIAIKGLAQDAEVRITDLDGQLVYKTEALGGQAIWYGQNLEGNEVAGGVYLVFSSSSDLFADIDTYVTKILVVK